MSTTARDYATDVLLRTGRSMHLRAIRPDDTPRLWAFFSCLSPQSVPICLNVASCHMPSWR
jgi:hypothetical protein